MPRPPQTESRSTPSFRAVSRMLAPSATSSRLPDGVKTILRKAKRSAPRPPPSLAPAAGRLALGRGFSERFDPLAAVRVVAHHDIGAEDRLPVFWMQRVHDRGGETRADHHRQEARVEAAPIGQAERKVGGAAARVDF